ncbi:MAG: hypothetical protein Q8933_01835 [Bacteroidota bacterium]|nr:hypothetical protein [Bacteroidota bacterium]MDP4192141.1 hypothetical protein [Bacteroidota bacterium]MDP4194745.1 hypothetical protein [Bacteroidota bacterium]
MKSQLFYSAIYNRFKVQFLYGLKEVVLEPYFISLDKSGKKVIYGRTDSSNEIKRYEFGRIANIKILNKRRFSPIIPLAS